MASLKNLEAQVRLSIANPNPKGETKSLFGHGIAELCMGVRTTGSLNAAAKSMHMAYSKAWRIIKSTEDALGFDLLERDGARGSTLTHNANTLLDAYYAIDKVLQDAAQKEYLKAIADK